MSADTLDEVGTNVDYLKMLDAELETACLPEADAHTATPDELIRDLHRVIGGNGGPTKGLVFKVAATNVSVKLLAAQVHELDDRVGSMEETAALAKAESVGKKKVFKQLWDNRAVVLICIFGVATLVNSVTGRTPTLDTDQVLRKMVRMQVEKSLGVKLPPIPPKDVSTNGHDDRPDPR